MKLLFVVTGIGYGHATRVDSVINEIKSRNKKCEIIIAGYKCSYNYFKGKYKLIKLHGVNYSSKNFNLNLFNLVRTNLNYPLNVRNDINILSELINKENPDWVIVDWEISGLIAASKCNKKSILIFNYDSEPLKNFIQKFKLGRTKIIQSKFVETIYSLAEKKSEAIFVPGLKNNINNKFHYIDFILRRTSDKISQEKVLMKKLGLKKKPILVMLGGSNFGYKLLEKLNEIFLELKDEQFIVFGYDHNFKKKNIICYEFNKDYLEYLKVSKGVIMLAGHSSFGECAVFKKPCLVFPIRGHVEQMLNAFTIENTGIGLVKYLKNIKKDQIKKDVVEFLENIDKLQTKANKLNSKGIGASQVADFLLNKEH
jgi:uncharacterized protein (TIGR00661 family)